MWENESCAHYAYRGRRRREKASLQQQEGEKSCLGIRKKKEENPDRCISRTKNKKSSFLASACSNWNCSASVYIITFFVGKRYHVAKEMPPRFRKHSFFFRIATRILAPFFPSAKLFSPLPLFLYPEEVFYIPSFLLRLGGNAMTRCRNIQGNKVFPKKGEI